MPRIVPELYCADIGRSLAFYVETCGFTVRYARPEERFAYIDRGGAELMLEEPIDHRRTFLAGKLEYPFGRGVNLQIEIDAVDALHDRLVAAGAPILLPLEDRWYRTGDGESGNRQFVVTDPDGYVLRFFTSLNRGGRSPRRASR